jgi:hypothetical protein
MTSACLCHEHQVGGWCNACSTVCIFVAYSMLAPAQHSYNIGISALHISASMPACKLSPVPHLMSLIGAKVYMSVLQARATFPLSCTLGMSVQACTATTHTAVMLPSVSCRSNVCCIGRCCCCALVAGLLDQAAGD